MVHGLALSAQTDQPAAKTLVRIGHGNTRRSIRKVDGTWECKHLNQKIDAYNIVKHLQDNSFKEDNAEVIDYMAQVVVDMLNAEELDLIDHSHLKTQMQTIKKAVIESGNTLGLEGAWREPFWAKNYTARDSLVFVSAYVRCGQYIFEKMRQEDTIPVNKNIAWWGWDLASGPFAEWWKDYHLDCGLWFATENDPHRPYTGKNNRLLYNFLELEIEGRKFLDAHEHRGNPLRIKANQWVAAFLVANTPEHEPWYLHGMAYLENTEDLSELRMDLKRILNPQSDPSYWGREHRYQLSEHQWDLEKVKKALRVIARIHENRTNPIPAR